jgi:putative flippase GtrA
MRGVTTFVSFVVCGGLSACCNIGSRWLFSHWLSYPVAIVLAFPIGLLTAFLLFKFFVFGSAKLKRLPRETFWFIAVNVWGLLQTLGVSIGLADYVFPWLGMRFHPYDLAHGLGLASTVIPSFFGHKYFTFSKESPCG